MTHSPPIHSFQEGANHATELIYQPIRGNWRQLARDGSRRVIIFSARQDAAAPPHNQRRLHSLIAGSTLVEFDGAHERALKEPQLFASHLSMLLDQGTSVST